MSDRSSHTVVVLALDAVIPLDLAIPVQVFAHPSLGYTVQVCGGVRTVRTTVGFDLRCTGGLDALRDAYTVVVPGFVPHDVPLPARTLAALRAAHARGARMISICTGAFALAQAGILDGRVATTHWQDVAELAGRYPSITIRPDVLYVDDGDVLTSAGVSSGLDLCLHIVRADHGVAAAQTVAQALVAAPHRDGNQAQFVPRAVETQPGPFAETCRWMQAHLAEDIALSDLAQHAATSQRTFARRFRETTGTTPLQWLVSVRLDEARRLLETTSLPVDEVAERCGFGTALNMRQHFRRRLDTTPTAYRRTFLAS